MASLVPVQANTQKIKVGLGYQNVSGSVVNSGVKGLKTEVVVDPSFRFYSIFCDTMTELSRQLKLSVGLTGQAYNVKVDLETSHSTKTDSKIIKGHYLVEITSVRKYQAVIDQDASAIDPRLKMGPGADLRAFYEAFGDEFVSRVDYGQKLIVIIEVNAKHLSKAQEVMAKLSVSASLPGSASVSPTIQLSRLLESTQDDKESKIHIISIGMDTTDQQMKVVKDIAELRSIVDNFTSGKPAETTKPAAAASTDKPSTPAPAADAAAAGKKDAAAPPAAKAGGDAASTTPPAKTGGSIDEIKTVVSFATSSYTALLTADERSLTVEAFGDLRKNANLAKQFIKQIFHCRNRLQHYLNLLHYVKRNVEVVKLNHAQSEELEEKCREIGLYLGLLDECQEQVDSSVFLDHPFSDYDIPLGIQCGLAKAAADAAISTMKDIVQLEDGLDFFNAAEKITRDATKLSEIAQQIIADKKKALAAAQKDAAQAKTDEDAAKKAVPKPSDLADSEQDKAQASEELKVVTALKDTLEALDEGFVNQMPLSATEADEGKLSSLIGDVFTTASTKTVSEVKSLSPAAQVAFQDQLKAVRDKVTEAVSVALGAKKNQREIIQAGLIAVRDQAGPINTRFIKQSDLTKATLEKASKGAQASQTGLILGVKSRRAEMLKTNIDEAVTVLTAASTDGALVTAVTTKLSELSPLMTPARTELNDGSSALAGATRQPIAVKLGELKTAIEALDPLISPLRGGAIFSWGKLARDLMVLTEKVNDFSFSLIDFQSAAVLVGMMASTYNGKSSHVNLAVPFETNHLIFDLAHNKLARDRKSCVFKLYRRSQIELAGHEKKHRTLYDNLEHRAQRNVLSQDILHQVQQRTVSPSLRAALDTEYETKVYHRVFVKDLNRNGQVPAPVRQFKFMPLKNLSADSDMMIVRVFAQIGPSYERLTFPDIAKFRKKIDRSEKYLVAQAADSEQTTYYARYGGDIAQVGQQVQKAYVRQQRQKAQMQQQAGSF